MEGQDPIVSELKKKSPITVYSENNQPLRLPLQKARGGDQTRHKVVNLIIKSKRLSRVLKALVEAKKHQKKLKLLQEALYTINTILTARAGLHILAGGSLNYIHIIFVAAPSSLAGFLMALKLPNPLISTLVPILILYGRGIEDIPDSFEKCRIICKAAEEYHNGQVKTEMKKLGSLVEETADVLKLPIDKTPFICVEEKLSITQRFKLKQRIKGKALRRRVQHFNEFIKQFPECKSDTETLYQEALEQVTERLKVKNN